MNWLRGKAFDGSVYTALMHGALEMGRYWHRGTGFVPESLRNNAKVRATEEAARIAVIEAAAPQLACLLPTRNVPRGTKINLAAEPQSRRGERPEEPLSGSNGQDTPAMGSQKAAHPPAPSAPLRLCGSNPKNE